MRYWSVVPRQNSLAHAISGSGAMEPKMMKARQRMMKRPLPIRVPMRRPQQQPQHFVWGGMPMLLQPGRNRLILGTRSFKETGCAQYRFILGAQ